MDISELIEAIDQQSATRWIGSAWRHVATGRPPMSGEGARLAGGRWNPPRSFAVLYLGMDVETVVAEFHRMARKQGVPPDGFLPRTLYRYEVELGEILDLRSGHAQRALHLTDHDLAADDPVACRRVGEAAFAAGREGVLAPSATGHGDVLAVFLERLGSDSTLSYAEIELWEQVPHEP